MRVCGLWSHPGSDWSLATKRLSLFLTSVAVACGLCELLLRVMGIGYGTVHMESSQILPPCLE